MKKTLYILAAALISMNMVSCSDFLDQPVRGKENLDTYFQTEEEANNFITGCYGAICFNDWWQIGKFWNMTDMATDDGWMGNTTQDQSDYYGIVHYQGNGQSNEAVANFWQYRYKGILRCNIAIQRIPEAPFADNDYKERLIAEAKFLRAFFYFDLVKNFGAVPYLEDFLMPEESEGITRTDAATVYSYIEQDLREAAAILPEKDEYPSADMGRATAGAAKGLLGKVYLYQEKYEECRDILLEVIRDGQYDLMEDFGDVWSMDHNNNKESLFEVQYMYDETYALGGFLTIITGSRNDGGWSWGLPTANLENAFIEAGDTERLKWTIIKNGATSIAGEDNFAGLMESLGTSSYPISVNDHKSPRINRKFYCPFDKRPEGHYSQNYIPLNHRILRYADVLLMYAEAKNELGEDASGEYTGQWALNRVRTRAKLPELYLSGSEMRDAIRRERRLELALEHNRLYDIRRWKEDDGRPVVAHLMGPDGTFVKYNTESATRDRDEWNNQIESSDKGITFDENRDLLFPVPLREITMTHGTITQNPGWN